MQQQKYEVDWETIESSGFYVQATNPNRNLLSGIKYMATEKSLKDYPYLETHADGKITTVNYEYPPHDQVYIE